MHLITPEQLQAAGVKARLTPTRLIEDFQKDWEKEWFVYSNDPENWQRRTHKIFAPSYKAPEGAQLAIEVRTEMANTLVIGLDQSAATIKLKGENQWQTILLAPHDFKDATGNALGDWEGIMELRLSYQDRLRSPDRSKTITVGGPWKGTPPSFRQLKWISESQPSP